MSRCTVCVCVRFCACVWSHLAGLFLEGNESICYKKAACDLTPGPCCSLPLSARRARDIARLRGREREGGREMKWDGVQKDGGTGREGEMPRQREMRAEREKCRFCRRSEIQFIACVFTAGPKSFNMMRADCHSVLMFRKRDERGK